MTQAITGFAAMVAVGHIAIQAVLPAPVPITIHSIAYRDGTVLQDRTVETDGASFFAGWAATVINSTTGESVRWCEGSGAFPYKSGRITVEFTLPQWTGRAECTPESLPPGEYFLRGVWSWGDEQTSRDSAVFEVRG